MNKQENTEYWARMTRYFSNELNLEEKSLFEEWAQKIDNQNLLKEMNTDIEQFDETEYLFEKTTDQAWEELHSRIKQEDTIDISRDKYPLFKTLYRVAAVSVIVLGLSWILINLTDNSQTLTTEFSQSEITLPDGSLVYLNANSKLIYPKTFKGESRRVKLIGEGYFDIIPNPDKPFIINANNAEIKVLGTKFNVVTNKELDKVEVLVESGVVSLSSKNNTAKSLLLKKGDFGVLKDNVLTEAKVLNPNYLSWKTKIMEFRNENLLTVLNVVNHTYGTQIVLETEPLKDLRLTSKYDNINLDTLLESICIAFDLKKSEINNQIILANKEN
jgi:ferric-dicitrate binding protein FerR (iron transport regulator)